MRNYFLFLFTLLSFTLCGMHSSDATNADKPLHENMSELLKQHMAEIKKLTKHVLEAGSQRDKAATILERMRRHQVGAVDLARAEETFKKAAENFESVTQQFKDMQDRHKTETKNVIEVEKERIAELGRRADRAAAQMRAKSQEAIRNMHEGIRQAQADSEHRQEAIRNTTKYAKYFIIGSVIFVATLIYLYQTYKRQKQDEQRQTYAKN